MSGNIIEVDGAVIRLANPRGFQISLSPQAGQYGLGEFSFKGLPVGPPVFPLRI